MEDALDFLCRSGILEERKEAGQQVFVMGPVGTNEVGTDKVKEFAALLRAGDA